MTSLVLIIRFYHFSSQFKKKCAHVHDRLKNDSKDVLRLNIQNYKLFNPVKEYCAT